MIRKSFKPCGFYSQLSLGHSKAEETYCMGVEVNKAVSVAHGASSVLDDTDIGSSKADVGFQHLHYDLRWSGTIDAL